MTLLRIVSVNKIISYFNLWKNIINKYLKDFTLKAKIMKIFNFEKCIAIFLEFNACTVMQI